LAPERGLDARDKAIVDLREAGIVDPAATLKAAVQVGLSMAMQANDCGVLVRRDVELWQAEISP
jgi:hypothetical protein